MKPLQCTCLIASLVLAFASCGDDETTEPTPEFFVKITAKDSRGRPVERLQVSMWNNLSEDFGRTRSVGAALGRIGSSAAAETYLRLACPMPTYVTLQALDLKGNVRRVLASGQFQTGVHDVTFNADGLPSGVYACRLVARESQSGPVLFRDTVYAVLHRAPDPDETVVGWTASNGTFTTTENLLFPILFPLPPIAETDVLGPEPHGTILYTDTITIVLTDTSSGDTEEYERVLRWGANEFTLTWDPDNARKFAPIERTASASIATLMAGASDWSTITIRDSAGRTQTLYFGPPDAVVDERCVAPPPPPGDAFDVRFSPDSYCARAAPDTTRQARILVNGPSFPLHVSWDYNEAGPAFCAYLRVNRREYAMFRDSSVVLDTISTSIFIRLAPSSLGPCVVPPDSFKLYQNFPNPFN